MAEHESQAFAGTKAKRYRFLAGPEERKDGITCNEAVHFYQLAVDELRLGLEDASQDLYPLADVSRLGVDHGLGAWGVAAGGGGGGGGGGAGGVGYLPWGAAAGGGGGCGGGQGGPARGDMAFADDMLLRAEAGDPSATMMMGYLHMVGSEETGITPDFAKAEQAVRNGDPGCYAYLAWMHHNGYMGGHLPPYLQPRLPDGGGEGDERAKGDGKLASRREGDLRAMAYALWGKKRVEGTNVGRGVPETITEGGGGVGGPAGGKGGSRSGGVKGGSGCGKEGDQELMPGEDVWGGEASKESWE
ncbi:unnamed protein product [Ectocarpus sp. CCAP 1310/34]|nr:unnamed protein product [Ectocarpus sp. CCAP 1310/34]